MFKVVSPFTPQGDQPEAIEKLSEGVLRGDKLQVLLGVTGSGKTYTMAKVIEKVQKPTLVLAHNKTLAAQLCSELKGFFPDSAFPITITTSRRPTSPPATPISRRPPPSTRRSTGCATPPPAP